MPLIAEWISPAIVGLLDIVGTHALKRTDEEAEQLTFCSGGCGRGPRIGAGKDDLRAGHGKYQHHAGRRAKKHERAVAHMLEIPRRLDSSFHYRARTGPAFARALGVARPYSRLTYGLCQKCGQEQGPECRLSPADAGARSPVR